jgi:hypothetical protein
MESKRDGGKLQKKNPTFVAQPLNAGDFRARKEKKSQNFIHVNKFE